MASVFPRYVNELLTNMLEFTEKHRTQDEQNHFWNQQNELLTEKLALNVTSDDWLYDQAGEMHPYTLIALEQKGFDVCRLQTPREGKFDLMVDRHGVHLLFQNRH